MRICAISICEILYCYHRVVEVFDHWDFVWVVSLPDVLVHCVGPIINSEDSHKESWPLKMGLTCCPEMFVANYSWHCVTFQEMEDSYAGLFRPGTNCHYFYLSVIIRTIICHIHCTDKICLTLWSYWFLWVFLSPNCCTGWL